MSNQDELFPYLHGFNSVEQNRLRNQARFAEHSVFRNIDFSRSNHILEIGCGVGGQTEILLRRFPDLQITGIDFNQKQLAAAEEYLAELPMAKNRFALQKMDAMNLDFTSQKFDGVFMTWLLEHVINPAQVLSEARRVTKPGGKVYLTEVMNSSFFLDPYSPNVWKYWMAFNDYQHEHAGDPFVGAKLGNLLLSVGYKDIQTKIVSWHFDKRQPEQRREFIEFWLELMMSAKEQLIQSEYTTAEVADAAAKEMNAVKSNPNGIFFYSFVQATARV